jgi:hydroxymethylbilane synthase
VSERAYRIGTRGSRLALWQAEAVARRLGAPCEIVVVETSGDRFTDVALQGRPEKGFFTKEIEDRLLEGVIDMAVHSLKDLPVEDPPGLCIGALLERAAVGDLLLVHPEWHDPGEVIPVRAGCPVGATSLRRQALLRAYAPQAEAAFLRGNVPTRIRKCIEGQYGAILLARAGVERLSAETAPLIPYELDPEVWLPAPGQGAIAVQVRSGDEKTVSLLSAIDSTETRHAVRIERGLLAKFEGGCHTAFGAWCRREGDLFRVSVGLERPGKGWGAAALAGTFEQCLAQGPDTLRDFVLPPYRRKDRP